MNSRVFTSLFSLFVAVLVDNFQLTLAGADLKKRREALIYLEGEETLEDIFKQDIQEQSMHKAHNVFYIRLS